jgi:hypothetical protein
LEELRLSAFEIRAQAELLLGRHSQLIPELTELTRENPLRERFVAQLAVALYRSRRQADALDAIRALGVRLRSELGLDPSPELQELERAMLRQDRELEPPPVTLRPTVPEQTVRLDRPHMADPGSAPEIERDPPPQRVWPTHRTLVAILGALVLLLSSFYLGLILSPRHGAQTVVRVVTPPFAPDSIAQIEGNQVASRVSVATPRFLAVDGATIWATQWKGDDSLGRIVEIDSHLDQVAATVPDVQVAPSAVNDIVLQGGNVWVTDDASGSLWELDARSGHIEHQMRLGSPGSGAAGGIVSGSGSLWVLDLRGGITRISSSTGRTQSQTILGRPATGIAVGAKAIWVAHSDDLSISRVDVSTGAVTHLETTVAPDLIVCGDDKVIIASAADGIVRQVWPTESLIRTYPEGISSLAISGGVLWVGLAQSGEVQTLRLGDQQRPTRIPVGGKPVAIAVQGRNAWVAVE